MFRLWLFCSTHAAQKGWASSEILSYLSAEGFNRKAILLPQFAQLISIDLYQLSKADKGHEIGFAEEPANSKNNASCTQQGKQGGYSIRKRYRNVSHSNNRRKVGPFLKAPFPLVKAVTQVTKKRFISWWITDESNVFMNTPVVARGKNEPYMTTVRDQKLVCRKMSQKPKIVSWGLTLKKSLENSSGSGVLLLSFPCRLFRSSRANFRQRKIYSSEAEVD